MAGIIEFFEGLSNIVSTVVNFVVTLFTDFVFVLKLIFTTVTNIAGYFYWLPSTLITLLLTGISVVVIYKVIGRD